MTSRSVQGSEFMVVKERNNFAFQVMNSQSFTLNPTLTEGEVGGSIEVKRGDLSPAKAGVPGCGDHGCVVGTKLTPRPEHLYLITVRPLRQMLPERFVTGHPAGEKDPQGPDALGGSNRIAREDIYDRLLETGCNVRH